jgi:membrane glycosyltransferase
MPVYNETTARTFAALEAIRESIEGHGPGRHFDYFILSDSTNADAWIAEERAFLALRERLARSPASTTATARRTITARRATSPIS